MILGFLDQNVNISQALLYPKERYDGSLQTFGGLSRGTCNQVVYIALAGWLDKSHSIGMAEKH